MWIAAQRVATGTPNGATTILSRFDRAARDSYDPALIQPDYLTSERDASAFDSAIPVSPIIQLLNSYPRCCVTLQHVRSTLRA